MEPLGDRMDTSQNLGRTIVKQKTNELDHVTLLKKYEGADSCVSTMAQNSQQTPDSEARKESSPFATNDHINLIDNTPVGKLSQVSYDLDMAYEDTTYSFDNRPLQNFDTMFEQKVSKRLTLFHAKPLDRTQFDKELLAKQLDLETVKITMHDEDEKVREAFIYDCQGQCENQPYRRHIIRETNQEGKWKRLINELEEMAQNYGIDFDEALKIFELVSCSKRHFKEYLENKTYTRWTELEDIYI